MTTKLTKKKPNKLLSGRNNYFENGGQPNQGIFKQAFDTLGKVVTNPQAAFTGIGPMALAQGISSGIGLAGQAIGNGISGGLQSGAGNVVNTVGDVVSGIPLIGGLAKGALNIIGGGVNALFGMKTNQDEVNRVNSGIQSANSAAEAAASAQSFDDLALNGPASTNFNVNAYKGGLFKKGAARRKNAALATELRNTYNFASRTSENTIDNLANDQMDNLMANFAAFGGPLFADGGRIYIKPENRGKFTETKKRTGKTTEELTHSKNPLTRKRAIFAQNAKKWHHAFGGDLITHGANFDTGLTLVSNGGTHEENPNEGVPMGMDSEGIPNLVEEGEVIFNDYVFSNRLKVPKEMKKKYKIRGNKSLTFADAALQMAKESEERPNDPISQAGLDDSMTKLMISQEQIREKSTGKKYAKGGKIGKIYAGEENDPYSQFLTPVYTINAPFNFAEESQKAIAPWYTKPEPSKNNKGIVLGGYTSNPTIIQPKESTIPKIIKTQQTKYPTPPVVKTEKEDPVLDNKIPLEQTWMRYAPVVASGAMAITDALGLTNKPDYGEANAALEAAKEAGTYTPIKFNPIGNYLTYKPFDTDYYINKLNAESGAARRALLNTSGGNRAQAMASILAADNNTQNKMGDLFRQAEEYNLAQRQKIEDFNRATNIANSEGFLKADQANQSAQLQARSSYLKGALTAYGLRQKERQMSMSSKSANLSNFINSLGDIGRENFARNMILMDPSKYYYIDSKGGVHYKAAYDKLSKEEKAEVDKEIYSKTRTEARGGYLTIRSRKRK